MVTDSCDKIHSHSEQSSVSLYYENDPLRSTSVFEARAVSDYSMHKITPSTPLALECARAYASARCVLVRERMILHLLLVRVTYLLILCNCSSFVFD